MIQSREAEAYGCTQQVERDYHIVPRSCLRIIPWECFIHKALAQHCEDTGEQMAIYIGGLIMEICPALEASLGMAHNGAIAMADAIVMLVPRWDLIIRQKPVIVLWFRLGLA